MQGKSQPPPARSYQAVMQQNAGTATRAECLQPWSSAVPLGWACPMLLCIWKEKLVPNTDPRYCELTELLVVPCLQPGHEKQQEHSQPPAGTSELLLQLCWQEHRLQGSKNLLEARMEQRLHRASSPSLLSIFSSDPRSCVPRPAAHAVPWGKSFAKATPAHACWQVTPPTALTLVLFQ